MKQLSKLFGKFEEIFLIASMAVILLFIFSQALFRYFFGSGLIWGEELARYVHIAQVWIGGSLAIKTGGHIRVTFFRNIFNQQIKKWLDLLSTFLFFTFMLFIAIKGSQFIMNLMETGQKAPSMGIPMAIPYTVVPLGAFLMVIRLIIQLRSILAGDLLEDEIEGVES